MSEGRLGVLACGRTPHAAVHEFLGIALDSEAQGRLRTSQQGAARWFKGGRWQLEYVMTDGTALRYAGQEAPGGCVLTRVGLPESWDVMPDVIEPPGMTAGQLDPMEKMAARVRDRVTAIVAESIAVAPLVNEAVADAMPRRFARLDELLGHIDALTADRDRKAVRTMKLERRTHAIAEIADGKRDKELAS